MKTRTCFLPLLAAACISFGSTAQIPETHIITLSVDTRGIDETKVDETSGFGQEVGVSNEDYTVEVRRGDLVIWQAVSSTNPEEDAVEVQTVLYEAGANVFGRNRLTDDGQNPGVIIGMISEGKAGDEQKYSIKFKVYNNGEARGSFVIDPKLRIKD